MVHKLGGSYSKCTSMASVSSLLACLGSSAPNCCLNKGIACNTDKAMKIMTQ